MSNYSQVNSKQRRRSRRYSEGNDLPSTDAVDIRIGNRRAPNGFTPLRVTGPRDANQFQRSVDSSVKANPDDCLFICVNGYRAWLHDIFRLCIDDYESEPQMTNREVQFCDTIQFPQKSDRRAKAVPWTFIVDQMNVPEVYYWTFGMTPPSSLKSDDVDSYRFRTGAWVCNRGAYRGNRHISVIILFTQPTQIAENIVTRILFPQIYGDPSYLECTKDDPDAESLAWLFYFLYDLLTDWQNIIKEVERRLTQAERDSRGRDTPVKLRARSMHGEVDRIYELSDYLQIHNRSFQKLSKQKPTPDPSSNNSNSNDSSSGTPASKDKHKHKDKSPPSIDELIWDQLDDASDDLDHYSSALDSLKERISNLIELEFNIESATQSDNSRFLSILGTLFLPISFLASVFGITTITWQPIDYLYASIPIFIVSAIFTVLFPIIVRKWQEAQYPRKQAKIAIRARDFTLLGEELPGGADAPLDVRTAGAGTGGVMVQQQPRRSGDGLAGYTYDDRRKKRASRSRSRSRTRDS